MRYDTQFSFVMVRIQAYAVRLWTSANRYAFIRLGLSGSISYNM